MEFEFANEECQRLSQEAENSAYCAFITFETEDGYLKAKKKYPDVGLLSNYTQMDNEKFPFLIDGSGKAISKTPVILEEAPEPDEIIWENLPVPWWSRLIRVICTALITLALLIISYASILSS
jgi:hypothetical protein